MKSRILGLLAETQIHPGTGKVHGVVDLPVSRERTTDYPVIFGSGVKGAIRQKAADANQQDELFSLFGKEDSAGSILFSDARLLLLPVRSLTGQYRWATCPYLIERCVRDFRRAGLGVEVDIPQPEKGTAVASDEGDLFLEERLFTMKRGVPDALLDLLQSFLLHEETRKRLAAQLVILHDDDFAWFARFGLQVNARNVLNENKKSKNLWYEETLPADSLFYALAAERTPEELPKLAELFKEKPYLQLGGNETTGQGWFAVTILGSDAGEK